MILPSGAVLLYSEVVDGRACVSFTVSGVSFSLHIAPGYTRVLVSEEDGCRFNRLCWDVFCAVIPGWDGRWDFCQTNVPGVLSDHGYSFYATTEDFDD